MLLRTGTIPNISGNFSLSMNPNTRGRVHYPRAEGRPPNARPSVMPIDVDPITPAVCKLGRPIRERLGLEAQLPIAMQILLLRLAAREASILPPRRSALAAEHVQPPVKRVRAR